MRGVDLSNLTNTVIGFSIRDKSIPSAQLMEKERALGLKAVARL